jgi:two-component system, OmpR family, phosphate regulon sensor histidine kinase PhoR
VERTSVAAVPETTWKGGRRGAGPSRWWRRFPFTPPRVVTIYALFGVLWIALSDRTLELLVRDSQLRAGIQTAKGATFVVLTSALLYVLIRRGQSGLISFGAEVRAAVDSMPDGVLVVGAEGVVEANRAALDLLGVARKEELLMPLSGLAAFTQPRSLNGSPIPAEEFPSSRALRGERVTDCDLVLRRADGRDVFVSVSAAPVDAPSRSGLAITVFRDISSARRLDEMREEFLATAAHELKTPLAVIKAYAQLVQKRTPAEAPALAVVQRQVDRMLRMVQHLLDASRLQLDPGPGAREPLDLRALALEQIERQRPVSGSHEIVLHAPGPVMVLADRERIGQVLQCLLDNAVHFSPRGGPVDASIETRGGVAVVSVADGGLGIAPERQGRIFERYYRAHAGTPEDYGGLGLSLSLSREIVDRHGGRMWFESTPGQGATFHFSLPLLERAS